MYQITQGGPVLLRPAMHSFGRPGRHAADTLIDGLTGQNRRVITHDPPASGRSDQTGQAEHGPDA